MQRLWKNSKAPTRLSGLLRCTAEFKYPSRLPSVFPPSGTRTAEHGQTPFPRPSSDLEPALPALLASPKRWAGVGQCTDTLLHRFTENCRLSTVPLPSRGLADRGSRRHCGRDKARPSIGAIPNRPPLSSHVIVHRNDDGLTMVSQ